MVTQSVAVVLVLMTIACGDESVPAVTSDPGDVIGTWRFLPHGSDDTPVEQRMLYTFDANGGYTLDTRDGTVPATGSFTADPERITLTDFAGTSVTLDQPYLAVDDRFILGPLVPTSSLDGIVGTWRSAIRSTSSSGALTTVTLTLVLRADGTAHTTFVGPTATEEQDGTWEQTADEVRVTHADNSSLHDVYALEPGLGVLGGAVYERL